MQIFLQIVLINLIVSFDNIGVIALATKNLSADKAKLATRIGIVLSVLLKIVFIYLAGYLLSVEWLHIRIIGGLLLLYIVFTMLKQHVKDDFDSRSLSEEISNNNLFQTIISIIAADVSMSLDNVLAILGVVASSRSVLTINDYYMILASLIVCIPILLWGSKFIAKIMKKFRILTYVCAGYLIYISIVMIFEDEMLQVFFKQINFHFTIPFAILCGILIVIYGILNKHSKPIGVFPIYCFVTLYALMTVAIISYLSIHPTIDGITLNLKTILGFYPSGWNAIYTIGSAEDLFIISALFISRCVIGSYQEPKKLFFQNMKYMGICIILYLIICTVGLTITFGIESINILEYLLLLLSQTALILVYSALFSLLSIKIKHHRMLIIIGFLFIFLDSIILSLVIHFKLKLLILLPNYLLAALSNNHINLITSFYILFLAITYILIIYYFGFRKKKTNNMI